MFGHANVLKFYAAGIRCRIDPVGRPSERAILRREIVFSDGSESIGARFRFLSDDFLAGNQGLGQMDFGLEGLCVQLGEGRGVASGCLRRK